MIRTFETRIDKTDKHQGYALSAFADLMSRAERKTHAFLESRKEWKAENYCHIYEQYGLTARLYLSVKSSADAKRKAVSELRKNNEATLDGKIKAKEKQISAKTKESIKLDGQRVKLKEKLALLQVQIDGHLADLDKPGIRAKALERFKKSRDKLDVLDLALTKIEKKLADIERDLPMHHLRLDALHKRLRTLQAHKGIPIAFGTKKLFKAQFDLKANGYRNHREWKNDWTRVRRSQFMIVGDASFPSGNDFVVAKPREDGRFDLEIRLPPALLHMAQIVKTIGQGKKAKPVGFITLTNLHFNIGHDVVKAAIAARKPLTYRFLRDGTSWKVYVMVDHVLPWVEPKWVNGALGVDLNEGHVAVTLVDCYGNPVKRWNFPCVIYGLSSDHALDMLRKLAARIARLAKHYDVPVVTELLDFADKKAALTNEHGARRARQLSSFAYSSFDQAVHSACKRVGVAHRRVNPAFTSIIGRVKTARRYGSSVHSSAALAIARRAMGFSERLPASIEGDGIAVPFDAEGHLVVQRPARIRERHVWSSWRRLIGGYKVALAAQWRAGRDPRSIARRRGNEVSRASPATGRQMPRRFSTPGVSLIVGSTAATG